LRVQQEEKAGPPKQQSLTLRTAVDFQEDKNRAAVQHVSCTWGEAAANSVDAVTEEGHTSFRIAFAASESLEEGVLDGMFSQVLEALLAEQDFTSTFETSVVPGTEGGQLFCVHLRLGIDAFEKLIDMQQWAAHIQSIDLEGDLTETLSHLFEHPESEVIHSLKKASFQVTADSALVGTESQQSMPDTLQGIMAGVMNAEMQSKLALSPVTAADLKADFQVDGPILLGALEDQIKGVTVQKLQEWVAEEQPMEVAEEFGQMLSGVESIFIQTRERELKLRMGPSFPVFKVFPQPEHAGDSGADGDDGW